MGTHLNILKKQLTQIMFLILSSIIGKFIEVKKITTLPKIGTLG